MQNLTSTALPFCLFCIACQPLQYIEANSTTTSNPTVTADTIVGGSPTATTDGITPTTSDPTSLPTSTDSDSHEASTHVIASTSPDTDQTISTTNTTTTDNPATTGTIDPIEMACMNITPQFECLPDIDGTELVDKSDCDADCTLPDCGDNHFNELTEKCDAGLPELPTGVFCRMDCTFCGDSDVNPPEETCEPSLDSDCRTDCTKCGDGRIDLLHGELCDGEFLCDKHCIPTLCGNSSIDLNEECDDGIHNSDEIDAFCSKDCHRNGRLVFISSSSYDGDLGGIDGAHQECSDLASVIPEFFLTGAEHNFRAWLSVKSGTDVLTPNEDPDLFASNCNKAYFLPRGSDPKRVRVTNSLATAISTLQLEHAIDRMESASKPTDNQTALTATQANGTMPDLKTDCGNWYSDSSMIQIVTGDSNAKDATWTNKQTVSCSEEHRLYCFEQCM